MGRNEEVLSKSSLWGVDLLIFVTVGTAGFQFNRLLRILDELCEENFIKGEDVIAQTGCSDYKPKNYKAFNFVSNEEHHAYINQCDFMISHSGTGSIVSALKMHKKIITFPRLKQYGEHVDNHQIELVEAFVAKNYVLSAQDKEELKQAMEKMSDFEPEEFISNTVHMEKRLIDFIEKI